MEYKKRKDQKLQLGLQDDDVDVAQHGGHTTAFTKSCSVGLQRTYWTSTL